MIFLDNVRVPQRNLIGQEGMGFMYQMLQFQEERLFGAASSIDGLFNLIDETIDYTRERNQCARAIGSFQAVTMRSADAFIDLECMKSTLWQAAWRLEEGMPATAQAAAAKWWACRGGSRVVDSAQHLHGGTGADIEYPIHRYFLWAQQIRVTLGGSADQLVKIGQTLA